MKQGARKGTSSAKPASSRKPASRPVLRKPAALKATKLKDGKISTPDQKVIAMVKANDFPLPYDPALLEERHADSQGYSYQQVLESLRHEYEDEKSYTESFKVKGGDGKFLSFFQTHF